eukprot:GCRY01005533.1.p1 GENE.GCRY01005533.1~~GCRY01005533.1.p1  ORF type:complete len:298 (+),score=56.29 GCRY01005533.1:159-1052(+)
MEDKFVDFYFILGVNSTSRPEEISKAYRLLARKYHPDKNKGDTSKIEIFHELTKAYETLSEPQLRQTYDSQYKVRCARKEKLEAEAVEHRKWREKLERAEREAEERKKRKAEGRKEPREELNDIKLAGEELLEQYTSAFAKRQKLRPIVNKPRAIETATVRIRWNPKMASYTQDQIKNILADCGHIEHVVVKARKGIALVSFVNPSAAERALTGNFGFEVSDVNQTTKTAEPSSDFWKTNPVNSKSSTASSPEQNSSAASFNKPQGLSSFVNEDDDFEAKILQRMKEASKQHRKEEG